MNDVSHQAVEIERMLAANVSPAQLAQYFFTLSVDQREGFALAMIGLVMMQKRQLENKV
ncbi:MAG: hypothetical protein WCK93_07480 [Nitrosomonadales bacterium]